MWRGNQAKNEISQQALKSLQVVLICCCRSTLKGKQSPPQCLCAPWKRYLIFRRLKRGLPAWKLMGFTLGFSMPSRCQEISKGLCAAIRSGPLKSDEICQPGKPSSRTKMMVTSLKKKKKSYTFHILSLQFWYFLAVAWLKDRNKLSSYTCYQLTECQQTRHFISLVHTSTWRRKTGYLLSILKSHWRSQWFYP